MKKFDIEMTVGYCASLTVEADSREEAIYKAKELVLDHPLDYYDGWVEIESTNFVNEVTK